MRRSVIWSNLLTLEPVEFGQMPSKAFERNDSLLTTAACEAIPVTDKDQYASCKAWLATLAPEDREPGWLLRYVKANLTPTTS